MTDGLRPMVPIPISAGKMIADSYGYDQVVIIARRVGDAPDPHGEHVTTYGRTPDHCAVAARIGDHLKHRVMDWPDEISDADLARLAEIAREHFRGRALVIQDDLLAATRDFARRLGIVSVPARNA